MDTKSAELTVIDVEKNRVEEEPDPQMVELNIKGNGAVQYEHYEPGKSYEFSCFSEVNIE